jgi:hypothetical protein
LDVREEDMSLPACEQRVLKHMEGALRASEPHLAAMYAIFAKLNAGEPVGAEPLIRRRPPRRGRAAYAVVLVPVMFAMIVIGALLSGSARGATTCGHGPAAARGVPWVTSRASCQVRPGTQVKTPGTTSPAGLPRHPGPVLKST